MPALDLVKDLIAFDTTSRDSNLALIDYRARACWKNPARAAAARHDASGDKANLFATFGPDGDGGFVLSGHTDVVPVDGQDWSSDPFKPEVRDGKLYRPRRLRHERLCRRGAVAGAGDRQGQADAPHPFRAVL